jgi:hypothetical protein
MTTKTFKQTAAAIKDGQWELTTYGDAGAADPSDTTRVLSVRESLMRSRENETYHAFIYLDDDNNAMLNVIDEQAEVIAAHKVSLGVPDAQKVYVILSKYTQARTMPSLESIVWLYTGRRV